MSDIGTTIRKLFIRDGMNKIESSISYLEVLRNHAEFIKDTKLINSCNHIIEPLYSAIRIFDKVIKDE